jgi:hypothetical protein
MYGCLRQYDRHGSWCWRWGWRSNEWWPLKTDADFSGVFSQCTTKTVSQLMRTVCTKLIIYHGNIVLWPSHKSLLFTLSLISVVPCAGFLGDNHSNIACIKCQIFTIHT